MRASRWFAVMVLLLACAMMCSTGCRKGRGKGSGTGPSHITDIDQDKIDEGRLPDRLGSGDTLDIITEAKYDAVLFDYDSAQIGGGERSKIEAVADYVKGHSGVGVLLEGNCDERGSQEYNLALGERRALAVRAYLIGLGIDGADIQTKSYGEENPVHLGHDDAAWSANRRADFVLFRQ